MAFALCNPRAKALCDSSIAALRATQLLPFRHSGQSATLSDLRNSDKSATGEGRPPKLARGFGPMVPRKLRVK